MADNILFPCPECTGKGFRYHRLGSTVCSLCKGTGKSDRQLLLDIQATQAQILELLQRPVSRVPVRDSRLDIIGPGLRQKPAPSFPTLTDADRLAIHKDMVEKRKKRNEQ
jgi:hypothetical protein